MQGRSLLRPSSRALRLLEFSRLRIVLRRRILAEPHVESDEHADGEESNEERGYGHDDDLFNQATA